MSSDVLNSTLPILFYYVRRRNPSGFKGTVCHLLKLEKLRVLHIMGFSLMEESRDSVLSALWM